MMHFSPHFPFRKRFRFAFALALALLASGNQSVKAQKVVMQGFWWDYWNSNYPNGWANYLADLAPRLKNMGVANKSIAYLLTPTDATRSLTVAVLNSAGTVVSSLTGTGSLAGTCTPTTEGWYTLKVKNASVAT